MNFQFGSKEDFKFFPEIEDVREITFEPLQESIQENQRPLTPEIIIEEHKTPEKIVMISPKIKKKREKKEKDPNSFNWNQLILFGPCKLPEKGKVKKLKLKENFKENLLNEKVEKQLKKLNDPLTHSFIFNDLNLIELKKNQKEKRDVSTLIEEIMVERAPEIEFKEKIQKKIRLNISRISNYISEKLNETYETKDEEIVDLIQQDTEASITKQRVFMAMVHFAHQNNTKSENQVSLSLENGGITLKKTL